LTRPHTSRRPGLRWACTLLSCAAVLCALQLPAAAQGRAPRGQGAQGGPGGLIGGRMGMGFAGDRGPSPNPERSPVRIVPQLGLPGRWWDDGMTARKVGLRSDQQRRMDEIFETNKGTLLGLLNNLQREENHLMSLPPGELQDENKVFSAIDRVAQARADLEKANAHLMLQIRQQMDAVQVAALDRQIAAGR
jgi:hypothetical protein